MSGELTIVFHPSTRVLGRVLCELLWGWDEETWQHPTEGGKKTKQNGKTEVVNGFLEDHTGGNKGSGAHKSQDGEQQHVDVLCGLKIFQPESSGALAKISTAFEPANVPNSLTEAILVAAMPSSAASGPASGM